MGGIRLQLQPAGLVLRVDVSVSLPPVGRLRRADSVGCCWSKGILLMSTSTATAERGAVKKQPADRLAAATAGVDQAHAELTAAERAQAEAVSDEQALAAQVRTLEQRIREGAKDVDPKQLIELSALHRFAELRVEAAQTGAADAGRRHDVARAHLFIAQQQHYAATDEKAYVAAFWAAVDDLAELKRLDEQRAATSETFKARREEARRHLVATGDTNALADLLALPTIEPHGVRGAVIALAIRHGLGAESSERDFNFVQNLPLRVPLAMLPVLETGRKAAV
jgi:hypothetical protein